MGGTQAEFSTFRLAGVSIAAIGLDEASRLVISAVSRGFPLQVHLCNAFTIALSGRDGRLRRALAGSQLNLPDGMPVVWLGRRYGLRRPIRGADLMRAVVINGRAAGVRHYVYGGAPGVAEAAAIALRRLGPGCEIAAIETPPFREPSPSDLDEVAARISNVAADIVWVGLGTPKQDYVVEELTRRTGKVVIPVGAAFDFLAGSIQEAPEIWRGSGWEWLYRLSRDPKRLWRRYLITGPLFIRAIVGRTKV